MCRIVYRLYFCYHVFIYTLASSLPRLRKRELFFLLSVTYRGQLPLVIISLSLLIILSICSEGCPFPLGGWDRLNHLSVPYSVLFAFMTSIFQDLLFLLH